MPTLPALIDLSNLGSLGFIVQGDAASDYAGHSVASAGDVNGDGFDDLIVGAYLGDDGGAQAGEAYVIFGKASGFSTVDLVSLAAADGFKIQGDVAGDRAGFSVASAGDFNGDGYDDLIVGAPFGDNGGANAGEAYIIFGKASGFGTIDLTGLAAADGFVIQGDVADYAANSVASAGDVNGDGYDDLIVGARYGGSSAGEAYVIFGKASGFGTINLAGLAPADGFIIQGDAGGDRAGWSVSSAGDINGDGYDDLIVGAPFGDDGGANAGEAYVIFGKSGGFGTIDLTGLAAADGFVIQGDVAGDYAGFSVASAGDVNGDGYDDLIVGARYGDDGGSDAGEAYVIFGKSGGFGTIDLTGLAPADGFIIQGDAAGDRAGWSVSSAGDVNGDGFDDIIVGARLGDDGGIDAGEAYVIFGKASGFGTIDLTGLAPGDGFIIQGDAAGDHAGTSVSSAGDLNGDGFDDLIVGAPQGDDGGGNAGEAYVIFGSAAGSIPFPFDFDLATDISPSSGAILSDSYPGAALGVSVASAGDINGDGFDDVIIGAPFAFAYGAAIVLFGSATGIPSFTPSSPGSINGFGIIGGDPLSFTGLSVSSAGDFNGDGYDDIIVGAPYAASYDGEAYLIFGKAGGFGLIELDALDPVDGFTLSGAFSGGAGWDVSSGDVNGDGFGDLIVGAPYEDYYGTAYVIFGKDGDPGDFSDINLATLAPADGFAIFGDIEYDRTALSVASGGDINGDGFDDILVGAPGTCGCFGPGDYTGKVWVVFGKETGLADVDLGALAPADGFVITGFEDYDETGYSVGLAGDINGDGFDEIIIGTPFSYDGGEYRGSAYVIFGKADGFGDIDLSTLAAADGFAIHGVAAYDGLGLTVSGAGDVNGDGLADIIVGAPDAEYFAGASYVIFGKAGGFTDIDLSALTAADGFVIHGAEEGDLAGSVSSAGDVDGDGFDDLIIGAPGSYSAGPSSGAAYIIYGRGLSARDDEIAVDEDVTLAGDLFADNGSGTDRVSRGHTFGLTEVNGSAANIDTEIVLASGAKLTVHADGTFDYDPNGQFDYLITAADAAATGAVNDTAIDTFTYTITGGETATVTIVVNGVESAGDELWGDATDNIITGTPDPDVFNLSQGGDDTISGLGSGDTIYFGAEFTPTDSVDGGDGDDELVLEGDYVTVPLVLAATSLVNVERITVLGGASFTYDITTNDGNVAAGETLIVDGSGLSSVEELLFDGTAESDGRFILIGGGCDDTLIGGGRDDRLFGGAESNYLDGGAGNGDTVDYRLAPGPVVVNLGAGLATNNGYGDQDLLLNIENVVGTDFNDSLTGDGEINVLDGGLGADTMTGGDGSDGYVVDNVGDQVVEAGTPGAGVDIVRSSVTFTLGANVENLDLTGIGNINATGNGDSNTLTGNAGNNVLNGGLGADLMRGGFGDDTYVVDNVGDAINEFLGQGTDTVQSSLSYTLGLGLENLTLTGAAAINGTGNIFANSLIGNANANILDGKAGADAMNGGLGNDTYIVDNVGDTVTETSALGGVDEVQASASFTLGSNIETLVLTGLNAINGTGNASVNTITGNGAANVLDGKGGADTMTGGLGNDTYVIDNVGDVAVELAGEGTDTIQTSVTATLAVDFENLTLLGTGNVNGTGNGVNNVLTGNSGANTLNGLVGADTMIGNGGNDVYVVDNGLDQVIEAAGGGTDTVNSSISYTLAAEIENLTLTGTGAINGAGNGLANTINGNDFNNILTGGLGADTLKGGLGDDTYVVDDAGDSVSDLAGQGTDTVLSSVSFTLGGATENLNLTGAGAINGTGNIFANVLNGNTNANVLNGGGGADTMNAGLGNDTYIVDNAGDVVLETSVVGGTDEVQSSVNFTLGSNLENLTLTGASAVNGTGNGQANILTGNGQANVLSGLVGDDELHGAGGADSLHGGLGNDTLEGGLGNDGFYFENALIASNVDSVLDFTAVNDTFFLDDAVFTALAAGTLAAGAFVNGNTALDASDRILYDSATGNIFYDADGSGGGASAILFATVTPGTAITNVDFVVY